MGKQQSSRSRRSQSKPANTPKKEENKYQTAENTRAGQIITEAAKKQNSAGKTYANATVGNGKKTRLNVAQQATKDAEKAAKDAVNNYQTLIEQREADVKALNDINVYLQNVNPKDADALDAKAALEAKLDKNSTADNAYSVTIPKAAETANAAAAKLEQAKADEKVLKLMSDGKTTELTTSDLASLTPEQIQELTSNGSITQVQADAALNTKGIKVETSGTENKTEGTPTDQWSIDHMYDDEMTQGADLEDLDGISPSFYSFKVPDWGYKHFAEEIDVFRKGLSSLTGEPGWFYFRIFFHFDDNFGLLGNILSNTQNRYDENVSNSNGLEVQGNSAYNYLACREQTFSADNIKLRKYSLEKFVKYLAFINSNAPWFFNSITGLQNTTMPLSDITKERSIEIGCLEDAVDMRLTSLFHLYEMACFDDINFKEIIPENLRKFNMSVAVFHMPLKYYDTYMEDNGKTYDFASLSGKLGSMKNRMTYKLFTFYGCEFDLESLGGVMPNSMSNEQAFNLGKNTIKIRYNMCYKHMMNNWEKFMVGSDGIYYAKELKINIDADEEFANRISALINVQQNPKQLQKITEATDEFLKTKFASTNNDLGNVFALDTKSYYKDMTEKWENNDNGETAGLGGFYPWSHSLRGMIEYGYEPHSWIVGLFNIYNKSIYEMTRRGYYRRQYQGSMNSFGEIIQSYGNLWTAVKTGASNLWNTFKETYVYSKDDDDDTHAQKKQNRLNTFKKMIGWHDATAEQKALKEQQAQNQKTKMQKTVKSFTTLNETYFPPQVSQSVTLATKMKRSTEPAIQTSGSRNIPNNTRTSGTNRRR